MGGWPWQSHKIYLSISFICDALLVMTMRCMKVFPACGPSNPGVLCWKGGVSFFLVCDLARPYCIPRLSSQKGNPVIVGFQCVTKCLLKALISYAENIWQNRCWISPSMRFQARLNKNMRSSNLIKYDFPELTSFETKTTIQPRRVNERSLIVVRQLCWKVGRKGK